LSAFLTDKAWNRELSGQHEEDLQAESLLHQ